MIIELRIRDFAIIDRLQMRFGPGFSVLTGETGAGKSIIIDGVNLLLGGRADSSMVRSGAERAQIEGVFELGPLPKSITQCLDREQLWGDERDRLVLAREVKASGRSVSRVNGRLVTLALLKQISERLVDVHGQSEHLSLMLVREHLFLLDRYAGLENDRFELADLVRQLEQVRRDLTRLRNNERELAQRQDLLTYQIEEIRGAKLQPAEYDEMVEERTRLANAEQLASLVNEANALLDGEAGEIPGTRDLLGNVVRVLGNLIRVDPSRRPLYEAAEQLTFQLDELFECLQDYQDQIEFNPRRLEQVQERLEHIRGLQRKYGDSIQEILEYAARARLELDEITHSEERIAELIDGEKDLLLAIGRQGLALSKKRRAAAVEMSAAVERELGELQMGGAKFSVDINWQQGELGAPIPETGESVEFDRTGLDRIEFLISPNPGEPLKPMVKIASGGETARLMLAIKTVLSRADQTPTLIFDEIDQGIGGRIGQVVGRKLWSLANGGPANRQVICVTHLPQMAGFGNEHFRVLKQVSGGRTTTRVERLTTVEDRARELAQMLGGDSLANRNSAMEILNQVREFAGKP